MRTLIHFIVSVLAIIIAAYIIPGVVVTFWGAFIAAVVLGIINIFIKPVIKLITLPITILTLGLFSLVLNALFVLLVSAIVPGFAVNGFWWALLFSVVLSIITAFFGMFERTIE